ncbi:MAG: HAD family hydrolase [Clostridiales bacterium]|nr:HAD family hydrolase [Clostridiales bacterium]
MRYDTVLFDLDGTLLDTLDDLTNAVNAALAEHGYPARSREEVRTFVGNGIRLLVVRALPEAQRENQVVCEEVLASFRRIYALHNNDCTAPYPGILPLLQRLKKAGVRMAVVSNKNDENVKSLCEEHFAGLLDEAWGGRDDVPLKPAPDSLRLVMAAMSAHPARTLYAGDSDVDVLTAANAGVDCAAVTWGFRTRQQLLEAGAEQLFATPDQLGDWIVGL